MSISNISGVPPPEVRSSAGGESRPAGTEPERAPETNPAGDQVRLTEQSQRLRELEGSMGVEPAFDTARVDALRKAIASGEYQVDSARVAGKLLDLEGDL